MKASKWCIELIKLLEGYRSKPYPDETGFSVGYGHYIGTQKKNISVSKEQAHNWLLQDVKKREDMLAKILTVNLSQRQFDALVLWGFNFSEYRYKEATFFKQINQKAQMADIVKSWKMWYSPKSSLAVQRNLKHRRQMETDLFMGRAMVRYPVYVFQDAKNAGLLNDVSGIANPNPDGYDEDIEGQNELYSLDPVVITAPKMPSKQGNSAIGYGLFLLGMGLIAFAKISETDN